MAKARTREFQESGRSSGAPVSEGPALSSPSPHRGDRSPAPFLLYLAVSGFIVLEVMIARSVLFGGVGPIGGVLSEIVFVLALVGIVDLAFSRWRPFAYAVTVSLVSLGLLAVVVYASYAEQLPEVGAIRFAGEAWAVRSSVLALFQPAYVVFVLGALAPVAVWWRWRDSIPAVSGGRHLGVVVVALSSVFACVLLSAGVRDAVADDGSMEAANSRGLLAYEVASATSPDREPQSRSETFEISWSKPAGASASRTPTQARVEELLRRDDSLRIARFATGDYKGSNLIVIQVESMQQFPVGMSLGDVPVTPRLNEIAAESWYFPNTFSQTGAGTTSDAEFVMNSSLYAPGDEPASVAFAGKQVPALPRLLDKQGYETFTMHANTVVFWNRGQLYPALGFEKYYDRGFFGREDPVGMGMSDRLMLKRALPVIEKAAKKGPIYCQLVTLSPHHPFNLPESKVGLELPDWIDGTILGNYLQSMNYEDRCVGWFVDKLKADGLWDNSIVVIYGDHFGIRQNDLKYGGTFGRYDMLLGHPYTYCDRANVPLIIHLPGQAEGKVVTDPVGQVDIMPTIADAMGLDLSRVTYFGRSAFQRSRALVPLNRFVPAGSFVRSGLFYVGAFGNDDFSAGSGISLQTRRTAEIPAAVRKDWRDAATLVKLSRAYGESLPRTGDGRTPANAIIPNAKK